MLSHPEEVVNMQTTLSQNPYFLGLDIGTDSVGYAVTDEEYHPLKWKGEPMLGVTLFDAADTAAARRGFRAGRRRLNRRKMRLRLVRELFAKEIAKVDPCFFHRLDASFLLRTEAGDAYSIFCDDDYTDVAYHKEYPTIHHLILDLMKNDQPHDVRLVYLACAWLVTHRGHFLQEISKDNLEEALEFSGVYSRFIDFFEQNGFSTPWATTIDRNALGNILKSSLGVTKKEKALVDLLYGGKKPSKEISEDFPFSRLSIIKLLAGGKVAPKDLFANEEYKDITSLSLGGKEETFEEVVVELGDDAELLLRLKALYDWSVLIEVSRGNICISEAKVQTYEQHQRDLSQLKAFVRKYLPTAKYTELFRTAKSGLANYVAYTGHVDKGSKKELKRVNQEAFCAYLKKLVEGIEVEESDRSFYEDMLARLGNCSFLPKQKTTNNRVIPYQLYWYELKELLKTASSYLPFLQENDEDGLSPAEKLLSIMEFRIPYFVGPLSNYKSNNAWMVRKAEGKIFPWNFNELVDLDASEQEFIRRMTNFCTYVPEAEVLPKNSLLYTSFTVLNEINNIKLNGKSIPTQVKQQLYTEVFLAQKKVTHKKVLNFFLSNGYMEKEDVLSGIDQTLTSSLAPYLQFKNLLANRVLNEQQVEQIIKVAAYSEDKGRFERWLAKTFPHMSKEDRMYVRSLKLKEFGRLSRELLLEVMGTHKETGETGSIMTFLWQTNFNLMQLLSDNFTFMDEIKRLQAQAYGTSKNLVARLDDMYVSNAVKRPIIRTMDIITDVVKAMGGAPARIFVEMARGATEDQKGKRTKSRYTQLQELYAGMQDRDEVRELERQLEALGETRDNQLQSDRLFLYFAQLGRCMYTGEPIDIEQLASKRYDIDHIYPQCFVKDDSLLNNRVLVTSESNGTKGDKYPIAEDIRRARLSFWKLLHERKLISDEKFYRLTRKTPFTDEEKMGFINRQLVETRQSTKAITNLLKDLYPNTTIVFVKAGLVSDFRQQYGCLKSRSVNDLHHAKDAYLNIVVGNVYHMKFNMGFRVDTDQYSMKTVQLFQRPIVKGGKTVWRGQEQIPAILEILKKNHIHLTKYAYCKRGGLFDQQPLKAAPGLIPLKQNLPTEQYGGYNKASASFFALVKYRIGKKQDVMVMPVDLMVADRFKADQTFAQTYAQRTVSEILGKPVEETNLLLDGRILKINTVFSFDGFQMCLRSKSSGGKNLVLQCFTQWHTIPHAEGYIKRIERLMEKRKSNGNIQPDKEHDGISYEENVWLYDLIVEKLGQYPYTKRPNNPRQVLVDGRDKFLTLSIAEQARCLSIMITLLNRAGTGGVDLSSIGGASMVGSIKLSSNLSNWKKQYRDVRIVDMSASGLFQQVSPNLLDLL